MWFEGFTYMAETPAKSIHASFLYDCRCLHVFVGLTFGKQPSLGSLNERRLVPATSTIVSSNLFHHYLSVRCSNLLNINHTVKGSLLRIWFPISHVIAPCAHANPQIQRSPWEQIWFKNFSWQEIIPRSCFHTSFCTIRPSAELSVDQTPWSPIFTTTNSSPSPWILKPDYKWIRLRFVVKEEGGVARGRGLQLT